MTDLAARPHGRLAGVRDALTPREWARAGAMAATIIGLHILGWGMLAAAVGGHYHITRTEIFGFGTGILAYTLGMRHAFDADSPGPLPCPSGTSARSSKNGTPPRRRRRTDPPGHGRDRRASRPSAIATSISEEIRRFWTTKRPVTRQGEIQRTDKAG